MKGETYHIVNAMRRQGREGVIQYWKGSVERWAERENATEVQAWLPFWQVRPCYTAAELAAMWPALAIATGFTAHWPPVAKSAKRLEFELDHVGLPRLKLQPDYFIVERFKYWTDPRRTLEEIENVLR